MNCLKIQAPNRRLILALNPASRAIPQARPRGARSKLGEDFLRDLSADWKDHGVTAITQARIRNPVAYVKIVSDILPREEVMAAFHIHKNADHYYDEFAGAESIEEILAIVAKETGHDTAASLAAMFSIPYEPGLAQLESEHLD